MRKVLFKIGLFIALAVCVLTAFGCGKTPDYFAYIGDLRKDIFIGENENFGVTVWAGARENPYASDGIKCETTLCLTLKVVRKTEKNDKITATVYYDDNEYKKELEFHPVKSAMSASFNVNVLPEKQLTVKLDYGDESCILTLNSALNDDTIPYAEALNRAVKYCDDYIKKHTEKGKFNAEISVRLLAENGNNYYYIGFIGTDGEKKAVLIDGETGSVLAEKNNRFA